MRSLSASDASTKFSVDYWSYTKTPIKQSLTVIYDPSIEEAVIKMFMQILMFSGVEESGVSPSLYAFITYAWAHVRVLNENKKWLFERHAAVESVSINGRNVSSLMVWRLLIPEVMCSFFIFLSWLFFLFFFLALSGFYKVIYAH